MLEVNKIHNGDCLELMKEIPDKSIDCIICDLPYGTTACSWDTVIPFDKLWEQYKRIRKDNTPIVLFGSEPFSTYLRMSNIKEFKYDWIWKKNTSSNFLQSNFQPRKIHELISIFSKGNASYTKNIDKKMTYFPQMYGESKALIKKEMSIENRLKSWQGRMSKNYKLKSTNITGKMFPESIIEVKSDKEKLHPTQKPVALLEYLIKTYSNEGDLILDNCSGSGSLAIACHNLKRRFICIEKNYDYWKASVERLENAKAQLKLF